MVIKNTSCSSIRPEAKSDTITDMVVFTKFFYWHATNTNMILGDQIRFKGQLVNSEELARCIFYDSPTFIYLQRSLIYFLMFANFGPEIKFLILRFEILVKF